MCDNFDDETLDQWVQTRASGLDYLGGAISETMLDKA